MAVAEKMLGDVARQESLVSSMSRAGEVDRGAVLGARLELVSGRLAELDARVRLQRAVGELENAMQTRMTSPPGVAESATTAAREEEAR